MALVDITTFNDKKVSIVYIAGRLSESKRVEQVLSEKAIDYAVAVEPLEKLVLGILPVKYKGIGFYVFSSHADFCRCVLREAGLVHGLVDED